MLKAVKLALLAVMLCAMSCATLWAKDEKAIPINEKSDAKEIVTTITSKIINIKRNKEEIEFLKNVVAEREDTSILADRMLVKYVEDKTKADSIEHIYAYGNVRIFNQEFVVTGDKGFYDPQLGDFIVEENVIFNNGTSRANGEKFIYNVISNKGYLTGADPQEEPVNENFEDGEDIEEGSDEPTKAKKDNRVILIIGDDVADSQEDEKSETEPKNNDQTNQTIIENNQE